MHRSPPSPPATKAPRVPRRAFGLDLASLAASGACARSSVMAAGLVAPSSLVVHDGGLAWVDRRHEQDDHVWWLADDAPDGPRLLVAGEHLATGLAVAGDRLVWGPSAPAGALAAGLRSVPIAGGSVASHLAGEPVTHLLQALSEGGLRAGAPRPRGGVRPHERTLDVRVRGRRDEGIRHHHRGGRELPRGAARPRPARRPWPRVARARVRAPLRLRSRPPRRERRVPGAMRGSGEEGERVVRRRPESEQGAVARREVSGGAAQSGVQPSPPHTSRISPVR